MNAFFNLARAARKRVDDRNRLTGHPRCVSENLPHSDLEVQKMLNFSGKSSKFGMARESLLFSFPLVLKPGANTGVLNKRAEV
jgi:hypothetical protein